MHAFRDKFSNSIKENLIDNSIKIAAFKANVKSIKLFIATLNTPKNKDKVVMKRSVCYIFC